MNPQGPHAESISALGLVMFWGGAAVFVVVLLFTVWALCAPPARRKAIAGKRFIVYGGVVFPTAVLVPLFFYSLVLARSAAGTGAPPDMRIAVIGHQWWWRVHYLDDSGRIDFTTANEIRIPVGREIELVLESADVLHSFWVPALAGKLDMIPGHVNRLRVKAAREGVFRGQCAEYCGGPHAKMALHVVAQGDHAFGEWIERQRRAANPPREPQAQRGHEVFMERCGVCHTVRGTTAKGVLGPDLTHVASRQYLAAGILPNNPGNLAGWIGSSQRIKPGNLMPSMSTATGEDLRALVAYVGSLE